MIVTLDKLLNNTLKRVCFKFLRWICLTHVLFDSLPDMDSFMYQDPYYRSRLMLMSIFDTYKRYVTAIMMCPIVDCGVFARVHERSP
jgi:hypothetical protein